eukprot:768264-Hanusia_phi.AAC.8
MEESGRWKEQRWDRGRRTEDGGRRKEEAGDEGNYQPGFNLFTNLVRKVSFPLNLAVQLCKRRESARSSSDEDQRPVSVASVAHVMDMRMLEYMYISANGRSSTLATCPPTSVQISRNVS